MSTEYSAAERLADYERWRQRTDAETKRVARDIEKHAQAIRASNPPDGGHSFSRLFTDESKLDAMLHALWKRRTGQEIDPSECSVCQKRERKRAMLATPCPDRCGASLHEHPYGCELTTLTLADGIPREVRAPRTASGATANDWALHWSSELRQFARYDLCARCGAIGWCRGDGGALVRCSCGLTADDWATDETPITKSAPAETVSPAAPSTWDRATFSAFRVSDTATPSTAGIKSQVIGWSEQPSGCITLAGPSGIGKTLLMAAALHVVRGLGLDAEAWVWSDLKTAILNGFDVAVNESVKDRMRKAVARCSSARVLFLDEVTCSERSEALRDVLEGIINHRDRHELPTLITTNASQAEWSAWSDRAASRLAAGRWLAWTDIDHRRSGG